MKKLLILNGPNLNLLGEREPDIYGTQTLNDIIEQLKAQTQHNIDHFQSNAEHELIECIHQAKNNEIDFILINPAAFTHTSVAIRDALLAVKIPFIELHLSNVHAREPFRQCSYLSDIACGVITGFGVQSYELALQAAEKILQENT